MKNRKIERIKKQKIRKIRQTSGSTPRLQSLKKQGGKYMYHLINTKHINTVWAELTLVEC